MLPDNCTGMCNPGLLLLAHAPPCMALTSQIVFPHVKLLEIFKHVHAVWQLTVQTFSLNIKGLQHKRGCVPGWRAQACRCCLGCCSIAGKRVGPNRWHAQQQRHSCWPPWVPHSVQACLVMSCMQPKRCTQHHIALACSVLKESQSSGSSGS